MKLNENFEEMISRVIITSALKCNYLNCKELIRAYCEFVISSIVTHVSITQMTHVATVISKLGYSAWLQSSGRRQNKKDKLH